MTKILIKTRKAALVSAVMAAVILNLSACGFALRGGQETLAASFPELAVTCNTKSDWQLCHYLNARITASGTKVNDDAPYELRLSGIESSQRAITLNPDATAAERELTHAISYRLRERESGDIIVERTLSRSQIYRHNASALIAIDREKEELEKTLNQSLVNIILREISIVSR